MLTAGHQADTHRELLAIEARLAETAILVVGTGGAAFIIGMVAGVLLVLIVTC